MIILIKDIRYEYNWGKLALHPLLNKKETLQKYYHLYKEWNGNPLFLYNFGAVLNQLENYEESNLIMNRCKDYLNDYDVQIIMGNNNFHLNQWDTAEYHYLIAHNMIPNRFLPLSYIGTQISTLKFYRLILLCYICDVNQIYRYYADSYNT